MVSIDFIVALSCNGRSERLLGGRSCAIEACKDNLKLISSQATRLACGKSAPGDMVSVIVESS